MCAQYKHTSVKDLRNEEITLEVICKNRRITVEEVSRKFNVSESVGTNSINKYLLLIPLKTWYDAENIESQRKVKKV